MYNIKPILAARKLYTECGLNNPTELPLETIAGSLGIYCKYEKIDGADGRILIRDNSAIITINSKIDFVPKRRFVITHEIGHFILHNNNEIIYNDTDESLNLWYQDKFASKEVEANEFAAEFLMPSTIFQNECKGKFFNPELIDLMADNFQVSKTAVILRYVKVGHHPICIVYFSKGKMKWWKMSKDFLYHLNFNYNGNPPSGSVAEELLNSNTQYFGEERKQIIFKSTWFNLKTYEQNKPIYEYCLYAKSYNYLISVLWED